MYWDDYEEEKQPKISMMKAPVMQIRQEVMQIRQDTVELSQTMSPSKAFKVTKKQKSMINFFVATRRTE